MITKRSTRTTSRLARILFFPLLVLAGFSFASAQEIDQQTPLSAADVTSVVADYKDRPVAELFASLKASLPKSGTDLAFRQRVLSEIPQEFMQFEMKDDALKNEVKQLFAPVLKALGRSDSYEIVLLKHDVPLVMIDTDSVIVLTTGWLRRLQSDDAALGFIAHEIGHRLYEHEMQQARREYQAAEAVSNYGAMQSSVRKIALIELKCDAFSAVVLAALGYDPTAFARQMELITEEYGTGGVQGHPAVDQRALVINSLAGRAVVAQHISQNLLNIRKALPEPALKQCEEQ